MKSVLTAMAVILVVLVIGSIILLWKNARYAKKRRAEMEALARRAETEQVDPLAPTFAGVDPRNIRVGDVVDWPGVFVAQVRGTIEFAGSDGYVWKEHFIDLIDSRKAYLSVEDGVEVKTVKWEEVRAEVTPGHRQITYGGQIYTLDEHGSANYRVVGTTDMAGIPPVGRVEYFDYIGPNDRRFSCERFNGGAWEFSAGDPVPSTDLMITRAS